MPADRLPPADRVIGILGGMGPEATVELMRQIIARTPAQDDADHVRMLVDNNPKVPSRIAYLLEGGSIDPTPTLVAMARGLEAAGATELAMACNTAHAFAPAIREAVRIPFIDMIDAALADIQAAPPKERIRFGVLGSPMLRRIGIFDARCRGTALEPVYLTPDGEARSLVVIRAVKTGDTGVDVIAAYEALATELFAAGADIILVCCTEFSVLEEKRATRDPRTLDSMTSLVTRLL
jgi:aspartate racemase